jgi:squalene-hopene/tetraprenyl-beta-curcumene cyclase
MWYTLAVGAAWLLVGPGGAPKTDPLAGTWVVVSTTNGENDDSQLKGFTATFADGKVTFKSKDGKGHAGTYTLDTGENPATINLVPADGPHKGKTLKGIFAVEKRDLKLCLGKEGEDRPTAFSSKAGQATVLLVLKKAEKPRAAPPGPTTGKVPPGKRPPRPWASRPDEPRAETLSLAKAAAFLDGVTLAWVEKQHCVSCHTGLPHLLARRSLGDHKAPALLRVRKFLEDRVAAWDRGGKGKGYLQGLGPVRQTEGVTEVVAIAATLALDDARATGKLHPRTRQALDRMWELQRPDGSWAWNKTALAPLEYDDYYGAVYAALGVGQAPEGYAASPAAREGVARLTGYLRKNPPANLHHKTWLLWASLKLGGLMTPAERARTVKDLLALQRADGGWNLPSLGDWKRRDGSPNDRQGPSDGYATGLVLYVLRQAGVPAQQEAIRRGVRWLKTNQRASGRWFTRSLNQDAGHVITNAGTAYALMALQACGVVDKATDSEKPQDNPAPTQVLNHGGMFRPAALGGRDLILLCLAFSPDGKTLVSAGGGQLRGRGAAARGELKLWEVATGKLLKTMAVENGIVFGATFSPDGKLLATASGSGTAEPVVRGEVRLWNAATGELIRRLPSHHRGAYGVTFSPDGKLIASGGIATIVEGKGVEGEIKLWDLVTGKELHTLRGHTGAVGSLAFSADGKTLASGGSRFDGKVKLWDVVSGTDLGTLGVESEMIYSLTFAPNAARLVVGSNTLANEGQGTGTWRVSLWDTKEKQEIKAVHIRERWPYRMTLSPKGDLIACTCGNALKVYDLAKQVEVRSLPAKFRMRPVAFSPDGRLVATGSDDGTVKVWSVTKLRK